MAIFIGQLVGFALIVFIVVRYVVPPVRRMMANQQETVRKQLEDSADAKKRLGDAEKAHEKAVERAKAEANAEVERIKVQGGQQVQLLRAQLVRQLRGDLGAEAVRRAGDLVRNHVADADAQSAT